MSKSEFNNEDFSSGSTTNSQESASYNSNSTENSSLDKNTEKSNDNSSNSTSENRKTKLNSTRGKVVSSKYKTAAIDIAKKGKCNSPQVNKSGMNKTTNRCFEKPLSRGQQKKKYGGDFSIIDSVINETMEDVKRRKDAKLKPNPKLHSTALNEVTVLDKTEATDLFSTSVIDNNLKIKLKVSGGEISNLSSISPINCETAQQEITNDITAITTDSKDNAILDDYKDIDDRLQEEYLSYLNWALVDIQSQHNYDKQIEEAQKQMSFLSRLVQEEEDKLLEERKALELIKHYNQVCKQSQQQEELLQQLDDLVEPCGTTLKELSCNLKNKLNKIQFENIYIPDDVINFKVELNELMKENLDLVIELNTLQKAEKEETKLLNDHITNLNECIENTKPCQDAIRNATNSAIHEASLKLTLDTVEIQSDILEKIGITF